MDKLCAKVYYELATGEVLLRTGEMEGAVVENTKEQDIQAYPELKGKTVDEIDFIELEYGTLLATFNNAKSYSINLETKTLEFVYYTQEELTAQKQEQEVQLQAEQLLNERTSTISDYMSTDTTSVTDIENYILQRETNKITGGVQ